MTKVRRVTSPAIDKLTGYLDAAQHAFIKGQYDVLLDAAVFEIAATVSDEDVMAAVYGDFNTIEHRADCSVETMIAGVHETLSLPRQMWATNFSGIPGIIEQNLRDGYWSHVRASIVTKHESLNSDGTCRL
jgi:hypothetical protein